MRFTVVFLFCFIGLAFSFTAAHCSDADVDPYSLLSKMEKAYQKIEDYHALFIKRERFNGEFPPTQIIDFYFKKPCKVFMKWIEGTRNGQELIYVEGMNDDKMLVKNAGVVGLVTLGQFIRVDPHSERALKNHHHSIHTIGIGRFIEIIMNNINLAREKNEGKLLYHEIKKVQGRRCHYVDGFFPKKENPVYYCGRAEVFIDVKLGLPIRIIIYDENGLLYEDYVYKNLEVNIGIKDSFFIR